MLSGALTLLVGRQEVRNFIELIEFLWCRTVGTSEALSMCERLAQVRCPAVRWPAAVRFLTRTFRNVLYVRVGKLTVRFWRSRRS